ncbi:MAG: YfiR family protein [Arcobacter sp.]|uniref:YfiR family protein n=1 Tax=Arcobacter sp. TaxID=1872629 RepID=UPI003B00AB84
MKQLVLFFILLLNILKADALPEYTLKVAYLYNFALLTDWSNKQQSSDFSICFYQEDFGEASDVLNNKDFRNQKIKTSTISSLKEANSCQIVFIRESEKEGGKKLIKELLGKQVLIVSENKELTDSHIRILQNNNKLSFDVSLNTLKESDLIVSSRLLKLARKVTQ